MREAREGAPQAPADENLRLQWELCFDRATRGIAILDPRTDALISLNPALAELHGGSVGDFVGKPLADLLTEESATTLAAHTRDADQAGYVRYESEHLSVDGRAFPVRTELVSERDEEGRLLFRIGWFEDMTGERRAEQARARALQDFEIAFHNAPIGVAIVGLDGRFVRVNKKLCEITGFSEEELEALTFQEITFLEDLELDLAYIEELLAGERSSYEMEKRYFTKQGHLIWIQLSAALVRDDDGEPLHFISQIQDVSKRKRMEAHLSELANRDPVTSLWNRRRFEEELERQVARCHRYGEQAALILLDLDGFKAVNDRGGHKAGDRLLRSIGRQLNERTRESDLVARIGGDEFAVLALNVSAAQGMTLADELRAGIEEHHPEAGVTTSVGVVHLDARAPSAGACFGAADAAMYDAKAGGGDRVAQRPSEPDEQGRP